MMNLKKAAFLFCLVVLPSANSLKAQIESVKFLLEYNTMTGNFDVSVFIVGGKATSIARRTLANTQVSIMVPTGASVEIAERFMPLQNNQTYTGTIPNPWKKSFHVVSPIFFPDYDIHSIIPTLSPPSHFNYIESGDTIKLFSLDIKLLSGCLSDVKLFERDMDMYCGPGWGGGDFTQGMSIGSISQLYVGNLTPSNTNVNFQNFQMDVNQELTLESSISGLGLWVFASDSTGMRLMNLSPGIAEIKAFEEAQGKYTFICKNDSITDVSCIVLPVKTSVFEEDRRNDLKIFPNPFTDVIYTSNGKNWDSMEIHNLHGHLIWKSNGLNNEMNTSSWQPGVYQVSFVQNGYRLVKKIIKI